MRGEMRRERARSRGRRRENVLDVLRSRLAVGVAPGALVSAPRAGRRAAWRGEVRCPRRGCRCWSVAWRWTRTRRGADRYVSVLSRIVVSK